MTSGQRKPLNTLPTGVPGLDEVLGGGLPEYSLNLIAGSPGSGKTTLAHQIIFANASAQRPAIYFTLLGEPPIKMLRYQQRMDFFEPEKVSSVIHFINLTRETMEQDLRLLLQRIQAEMDALNPGFVVVDSFRSLARATMSGAADKMELPVFLQTLAHHLAGWQTTSLLVGEYQESEIREDPVSTVVDGLIQLSQNRERNSVVRKLEVGKMRGQENQTGLHTFRITQNGLQVFPRLPKRVEEVARALPLHRLSTGVAGLDEMLGGGLPAGDAVMLTGPTGSGKTVLSTQFINEGVKQGEKGIIAVFEEHPNDYLQRTRLLGFDFEGMLRQGQLEILYLRPLDLSVEETLQEIRSLVEKSGATRLVIDSLSGFEVALAPSFREDFRESIYRLVGALTGLGVTVLMTVEVTESFAGLAITPYDISFLADDVIIQRYAEIDGDLRRVLAVVKMRSSQHSPTLWTYNITAHGMVMGQALTGYRGILTGVPEVREASPRSVYPGLIDQETMILQALIELEEATAEALAQRTGLRRSEVARALGRLQGLNYTLKVVEEGRTIYRPAARARE